MHHLGVFSLNRNYFSQHFQLPSPHNSHVTFDHSHVLSWALQEVKGEALHCQLMRQTTKAARHGVGVVVWRMCYPAHIGNEVSCGVINFTSALLCP